MPLRPAGPKGELRYESVTSIRVHTLRGKEVVFQIASATREIKAAGSQSYLIISSGRDWFLSFPLPGLFTPAGCVCVRFAS